MSILREQRDDGFGMEHALKKAKQAGGLAERAPNTSTPANTSQHQARAAFFAISTAR